MKKGKIMNKHITNGKLRELKGMFKQQWGNLTDDDIAKLEGKEDQLIGLLQQKYGFSKDRAEKDIEKFVDAQEKKIKQVKKDVKKD